jgi:4-hydroxybenzoate polyprenyltransferase
VAIAAVAMVGFQFSIGALNDLVDVDADARAKPWKPIPVGRVSRGSAALATVLGAFVGVAGATVLGLTTLVVGLVGYLAGVAYDVDLRRRGLDWLAFVVAVPMLPVFAWLAATGTLPPGVGVLVPLAALAGPTLHVANALVDVTDPDATRIGGASAPEPGLGGLVDQLGPGRALRLLVLLTIAIHLVVWLSLVAMGAAPSVIAMAATSSVCAMVGLAGSSSISPSAREAGWVFAAVAMALMAAAWLSAAGAAEGSA